MSIRKMISLHPDVAGHVNQPLGDAAHHLMYCARMCLSCADACAAEEMDMSQCIRTCLDCSDICEATGKVAARYPAPGAKFLNDVAIAPDGEVLVSDSGTARIYALRAGAMQVWLEHPSLRSINGLLPERDGMVVTTMQGELLSVRYRDKAVTRVAGGIGLGDGVARLKDGSYLASEWPGRLFHVARDGSLTTLIDARKDETYFNDFILAGQVLYAPHWKPGSLSAYAVR